MPRVEVAYALPEKQRIVAIDVADGATAREAAEQSGITREFSGLDLESARMGVFGKAVPDPSTYVVQDGDRIEIYRALIADPKEARKQRAKKTAGPD